MRRHPAAAVAQELNRNIGERERAESRLRLTQQLFAALSEVNETIVRVREREELFRRAATSAPSAWAS